MSKRPRRNHNPAFKTKVALAAEGITTARKEWTLVIATSFPTTNSIHPSQQFVPLGTSPWQIRFS